MSSFTDQKPRIATEDDLKAPWGGAKNGKRFRCYLCGHRFKVGDQWRWVYSQLYSNFLVCQTCDGEDVLNKWYAMNKELRTVIREKFWWDYYD